MSTGLLYTSLIFYTHWGTDWKFFCQLQVKELSLFCYNLNFSSLFNFLVPRWLHWGKISHHCSKVFITLCIEKKVYLFSSTCSQFDLGTKLVICNLKETLHLFSMFSKASACFFLWPRNIFFWPSVWVLQMFRLWVSSKWTFLPSLCQETYPLLILWECHFSVRSHSERCSLFYVTRIPPV